MAIYNTEFFVSFEKPLDVHTNHQLVLLHCTDLEVANVDTVKSDESRVQTDICLGEGRASEVALTGENLLDPIESGKDFSHSLVIGLLLGRKTRTVHSIVDVPEG